MKWMYEDQEGRHILTEEEILRDYFQWWSKQMRKIGKVDGITEQACIEDWVVVNWAQRID